MYVCLCIPTTDREIRQAVEDGYTTCKEIGEYLGAGTGCSCCCKHIRNIIEEHQSGRGRTTDKEHDSSLQDNVKEDEDLEKELDRPQDT